MRERKKGKPTVSILRKVLSLVDGGPIKQSQQTSSPLQKNIFYLIKTAKETTLRPLTYQRKKQTSKQRTKDRVSSNFLIEETECEMLQAKSRVEGKSVRK